MTLSRQQTFRHIQFLGTEMLIIFSIISAIWRNLKSFAYDECQHTHWACQSSPPWEMVQSRGGQNHRGQQGQTFAHPKFSSSATSVIPHEPEENLLSSRELGQSSENRDALASCCDLVLRFCVMEFGAVAANFAMTDPAVPSAVVVAATVAAAAAIVAAGAATVAAAG